MTKKFDLKAETRKDDKKINELIEEGFIPAVIYGGNKQNQNLKIKTNEFIKVYKEAGESSLVDLTIDDKNAIKVIVKEAQEDHIKNRIRHVDFFRINMKVAIEIEIPLQFTGTGKAIKDLGGMVLTNLESITAKCLPGDLIDNLEIDLDALKTLNDSISVRDLDIPDTIEVLNDKDASIVSATLPTQEKEEEPVDEEEGEEAEKTDGDADDKDKKEKKEEPADSGEKKTEEKK